MLAFFRQRRVCITLPLLGHLVNDTCRAKLNYAKHCQYRFACEITRQQRRMWIHADVMLEYKQMSSIWGYSGSLPDSNPFLLSQVFARTKALPDTFILAKIKYLLLWLSASYISISSKYIPEASLHCWTMTLRLMVVCELEFVSFLSCLPWPASLFL